jgi:hypothetical protein
MEDEMDEYDRFSVERASIVDSWVNSLFSRMERLRVQTGQTEEVVAEALENEFIGMGEQYLDWCNN